MSSKVCTKCKIDKPFTEFSKKKTSPDGLQYICKQCHREYSHEYDLKRKDWFNYDDPYYKDNKKVCSRCGIEKPLLDFTKDAKATNGLKPHCNVCRKPYYKKVRTDLYNPVVYNIINKVNGDVLYVGESEIPELRKQKHFSYNADSPISRLISSGEISTDILLFEIIEHVEDKNKRLERETFWIKEKKPKYNIKKV